MARAVKKLSARTVTTLTQPGRHSDGDGLYLVVDQSGARRWLFMFRWQGKLKEMGLGGVSAVSLADARDKAAAARKLLDAGVNPIEARKTTPVAIPTFGEFADDLVKEIGPGFRNAKHLWQWSHTLKTYAAPIRSMPINEVSTEHVLNVLKPIWTVKQETASRLRGRIERVLDAAKAKGRIASPWENPARWRGHLDKLLPRRKKLQRGHHPAMPYRDVPAFIAELRQREAVSALALEFLILCASRTGEVIGAKWPEVDRKAKIWTIPPERMKAGKEHRVPLTERALVLLDEAEKVKTSDYVFPGQQKGKPLSNMAMASLLNDRMKKPDITVHGFRSSFRDWAGETTSFPREVTEAALAHSVGDEVERAYRRGDALEKRRKLLHAWASYIDTPRPKSRNVTPVLPRTAGSYSR